MLPIIVRKRFLAVSLVVISVIVAIGFGGRIKAEVESLPFFVPTITATKADVLLPSGPNGDVDGDGRVDPGDTIEYSVTINNTAAPGAGNDATAVKFQDMIDANTTLVLGSVVVSPLGTNDAYTASGNIQISIPDGGTDLLNNDIDPITGASAGLTATAQTISSASCSGGCSNNVVIAANGSFTYDPPAGFTGNDTFTYTVNSAGGTSTATATIAVSNAIWFINNTAAGSLNRGTFTHPFTTIASFNTANTSGVAPNPQNGHHVVLRGTTYNEADGINLRNSQTLTGGAVVFGTVFTADANSTSAYTTFAGSTPGAATVNATSGDGVDLASGNALRGFNVGNTPGFFGFDGTAVGTLTVATVNKTGTGGAINVATSGTFTAVSFGTLESTSTPNDNISLVGVTGTLGVASGGTGLTNGNNLAAADTVSINGGSVSFTYPSNMSKTGGANGNLINVTNGHTGTLTFNTGTLTATNGGGLVFNNADGTYNFNGTTNLTAGAAIGITSGSGGTFMFGMGTGLSIVTGNAFTLTDSTAAVTYFGNITKTNNDAAVNVQNHTTGIVTFQTGMLNITGGLGLQFNNADSTYNFNGTTTLNGGDAGIDIFGNSGGTFTFASGVSINNPTNGAYREDTSTANVTYNGTITQNSADTAIDVNAKTAGTTAFSGTITASTTTVNAIDLTNTGGTVNFTGGLNLTTTSGVGFNATGVGATVTATQNNTTIVNTVTSTTGTALNVASTTIGANNLTFRSIASNGAASAIVLNTTGPSGGLKVIGNGGTCTSAATCTGGAVQNSTGPGVNLTSTSGVSFSNFAVLTGADDGIRGLNVSGLTLTNSHVANNGNVVQERGLDLTNLTGTASITGSTITNNAEDNLYVQNGTGILNLTTTGTTYANTSAAIGNDGIHFLAAAVAGSNNANMSITVTNCIFTNHRGDHFQALTDAATTGTQTVVFQNNDMNNTVGTNLGAGLTFNPSGNATVNFNISNNGTLVDPFTGAFSSAITINSSSNANMSGTINNNVIGNPAVIDSGSFSADAITVFANQKSDITVAITNNRLREYSNTSGINMQARDDGGAAGAGGSINATITGNVISDPGTFAGNGIFSSAGSVAGDDHFMCVDIGGAGALANTIVGSGGNGVEDFFVRQRFLTTVRLPGYAGANNNDAAVVAFIQGRNTGAETGLATNQVATGGGGFVGGAACSQPTMTANLADETAILDTTHHQSLADLDNIFALIKAASWAMPSSSNSGSTLFGEYRSTVDDLLIPLSGTWAESTSRRTGSFSRSGESAALSAESLSRSGESTSLRGESLSRSDESASLRAESASRRSESASRSDESGFLAAIGELAEKFVSAIIPTALAQDEPITRSDGKKPEAPLAGETICVDGGGDTAGPPCNGGGFTLPASRSVTIKFRVTANPLPVPQTVPSYTQVFNQGTVSGSNFTTLQTDADTGTAGAQATVTPIDHTTVVASSSGSPSAEGQSVTLTATITGVPTRGNDPTGTVQFRNNGLDIGTPQPVTIGATANDSIGVATFATTALPIGTNSITAYYSGGAGTNPTGANGYNANVSVGFSQTVNAAADLIVTKADSPDNGVIAGQNITYTINFVNNGPSAAQNVTVTDSVPTNTTFVSAVVTTGTGWSVNTAGPIVFSKGTVAAAETAVFTMVVTVNTTTANGVTITNNAVAAATTGDPTSGNNTGTAETTVVNEADVEIVSNVDVPDPVVAGNNITYTIVYENNGPNPANGVTVTDALSLNTTFVLAIAPLDWTVSSPAVGVTGNVVFTRTGLSPAAEMATFTVVAKVNPGFAGMISNIATAATASSDPDTTNNAKTATTNSTVCTPPPMDLVAWYTGDNTTRDIAGGHDGTFGATPADPQYGTGKVNQGFDFDGNDYVEAADHDDLDLTDALTIDAWVNPTVLNQTSRIVDKLSAGQTDGYLLDYIDGTIRLIAGTRSATTNAVVAPAGDFTHIAATYDGTDIVIYVNGAVAPSTQSGATGVITANALPLRVGASQVGDFGFSGTIDEIEIFNRVLSLTEMDAINDAGSGGKCRPFDLRIDKEDVSAPFDEGAGESYTITVTNDGPATVSGTTTVTDTFPAGVTPGTVVAATGWSCTTAAPLVTCTRVDGLASGSSYPTITIPVAVSQSADPSVSNTASVGTSPTNGELDTSDNSDSETTSVNDVAQAPSVTSATTTEDTQTPNGQLVISRAGTDGTEVTHFKITNITNGTLFQNNGTAQIANDAIITFAEGNLGLRFTPAANLNSPGSTFSFNVQAALSGTGTGLSSATMATITVNAVNDVPVAQASSVTTNEDTAKTFVAGDFLFTDVENNALQSITIASLGLATGDTLKLSGVDVIAGQTILAANIPNLVYAPASNANGNAISGFQFRANDGGAGTVAASMTINVTAVNDVPIAQASSVTTNEDTAKTFAAADFLFTDVENDAVHSITIASLSLAAGDALRLSGTDVTANQTIMAANIANLVYTPAANAVGSPRSSFQFRVNDAGSGTTAAAMTINVTAINDVPVAQASSVTTNEDAARTFVLSDFAFTDAENNPLVSITIGTPGLAAGDTLRLSGTDVTAGQTIPVGQIGNVVYTSPLDANGAARSTFQFTANDSGLGTQIATMTINVTAVNDVPTLDLDGDNSSGATGSSYNTLYAGSGVPVGDTDVVIADVDNTIIATTTITIPTPAATESLSINGTLPVSITAGAYNAGTGTLTLTGTGATLDDFELAIRQVIYSNSIVLPNAPPRTVNVVVNDGAASSNTAVATITFNTQPVASAGTATTNEDTQVAITLNASDADNNDLTFSITQNPANGTLSGISNTNCAPTNTCTATVTYIPALNLNGGDSFRFRVNDGAVNSPEATVTVTVNAVNDAPVAVDDSHLTNEDTPLTLTQAQIKGNDTDVDNTNVQLTVIAVSNPANGTVVLNGNGTVTFTPAANFNGTGAGFDYTLSDGSTSPALTDTGRVSINVTAINDAPTLNDPTDVTISEDAGQQTVNLTGIAAGPGETQTLTVTASSNNTGLIPNPAVAYTSPEAVGSLSFTPVANQSGSAVITVTVTDNGETANGGINTFSQTFTVTVNNVNDAPTLNDPADVTINEDAGPQTVNLSGISAGPANENTQILGVTALSNNTALIPHPAVTYTSPNATGSLGFTPVANQNGTATITVTVTDDGGIAGGGANNFSQSFAVNVTAVNDPPSFTAGANQTIAEDAGAQTVVGWATNISQGPNETGQTLTFNVTGNTNTALFSAGPAVNAMNGNLTYTPAANANGTATITLTLSDNGTSAPPNSNTTASQMFTITVTAVNDPPTFTLEANQTVNEDAGPQTVAAFASSILPGPLDESSQTVTFNVTNNNNPLFSAQPAISSTGTLIYTPAANAFGTATVNVTATDSGGATSSLPRTFVITVNAVNDAPVANNDSYSINEDTPLTVGAAGVLTNDTDVDNANAQLSVATPRPVSGPTNGTLTLNANGSFIYTPNANYFGTDSFTYRTTDSLANSNLATVAITVNAVNDAPMASNDAYSVTEDTTLTVATAGVLTNDADVDNTNVQLTVATPRPASGPLNGTLTLNADGSFTYTPNANYFGADSFTYRTTDGLANSNLATVTITVNAVNDAPVANNDSYVTIEDNPLTVAAAGVLANDTDVDNTNAQLSVATPRPVSGPTNGTLTLNADGSFTYTPNANYFGSDSFTYRVSDGTATSNTATVNISVSFVNDAPVANNNAYSTNEDMQLVIGAVSGVLMNDTDVDHLNLQLTVAAPRPVSGPANGTLILNANGSFTYTPNPNFNGTDTFTYRATDGTATSNLATVTITVIAINDAPVANGDTYAGVEDTVLTVAARGVLINDTDIDNTSAQLSVATPRPVIGPSNGTLVLNADGSFTYTPNPDFAGMDSFTYVASDGIATSNLAMVTLAISDVPDTVAISGNIQLSTGSGSSVPLAGVTVGLSGSQTQMTTTNAAGNYSFTVALGGSYGVTPSGLGKTYEPIGRTYANISTSITNADFLAFDAGALQRNVRIQDTFAVPGSPAAVLVIMNARGNERQVNLSLAFDTARVNSPTVSCGVDAPGCAIVTTPGAPGEVGISVSLSAPLTAGDKRLLTVTFQSSTTTASNTSILFTDSPVARGTFDVGGNPLSSTYTPGIVIFTGQGNEGDLAPRFTGDGLYRANDVEQERNFVAGLASNGAANEYERADVAPYASKGDGQLNAADFQLVLNYVAGLVAPQTAGGPIVPFQAATSESTVPESNGVLEPAGAREFRGVPVGGGPATFVSYAIELVSTGEETVTTFSLQFDQTKLSINGTSGTNNNPDVTAGSGANAGTSRTVNATQIADGRIGVLLDFQGPLQAGARQIVVFRFRILPGAQPGFTPITFVGTPIALSTTNRNADPLTANYTPSGVTVLPLTATGVTVGGRVTTPNGQGLRNALVHLTNSAGQRRTVVTSSFGFYAFNEVQAGSSYVVGVSSKRYRFAPRILSVSDSVSDIDFVGLE